MIHSIFQKAANGEKLLGELVPCNKQFRRGDTKPTVTLDRWPDCHQF